MNVPLILKNSRYIERGCRDCIMINTHQNTITRLGVTVRMHPMGRRIAMLVLACAPHAVAHTDLVEALYGDDPAGGPDWPARTIDVHKVRLRAQLRPLGIEFVTIWRQGMYAIVREMLIASADLCEAA